MSACYGYGVLFAVLLVGIGIGVVGKIIFDGWKEKKAE